MVSTYYGVMRLLATCAAGSHSVAETLLESGLPGTLRRLLASSPLFSSTATSSSSVLRSTDQLLEVRMRTGRVRNTLQPTPQAPDGNAAI